MDSIKKKLDDKIRCERYILDVRGMPIYPGNIVAISRSGQNARGLELYIVSGITADSIIYAGIKSKYHYDKITKKGVYTSKFSLSASRSDLYKEQLQQHIVVVDNPLFAIENSQMKRIIEHVDLGKESGMLPSDYKIGNTIIEYKDEHEA